MLYKIFTKFFIILNIIFITTSENLNNSSKQFSLTVNLFDNNYFSLDDPKIHENIYSNKHALLKKQENKNFAYLWNG